ncbi:hypothetical protein SOM22_16835 [Stenotrophomonas rhizophila]|uniref:hypothetical protein n=1 Tax=Stenotrophomonas rhizophila TaxID=216778 RepID=UPI0028B00A29|nr:hypothetical protein [Stenotrophomonas rhizophila]MDY0956246.1 hypothetical protein [Stenotrophomonas rhizophila]
MISMTRNDCAGGCKMDLTDVASWASILSLGISLVSFFLIKSVRAAVVATRRRARLRFLFDEILTIQPDAVPLSSASRSKFKSLENNLPRGLWAFWTAKSKTVRSLRRAIKDGDISLVIEGLHDYKSHCEEDL